MRAALPLLAVLALPLPARACLWDRDTLAVEAAGLPDVPRVLTGRFERNPPLYYEMRLERVQAALQARTGDLGLYDDAAVAADRLGRTDEAIDWMARKRAAGAGSADDRYRSLANLGTFHVHRWIREGARHDDPSDLRRGRDLLRQAIELNPDAHFGRERVQLAAVDWLLEGGLGADDARLPSFVDPTDPATVRQADALIEGASGLVVLGAAWESVDVLLALADALKIKGHASLQQLALLRVRELIAAGRGSRLKGAPSGDALAALIERHVALEEPAEVTAWFERARDEAEAWHQRRTEYMVERMKDGEHPDTHADFWADWTETEPPPMPGPFPVILVAGGSAAVFLLLLAITRWRRRRRRRA